MAGREITIIETGRIIDGQIVPDKNFKPHKMIMNSYKTYPGEDDEWPVEEDEKEIKELSSSKTLFLNPPQKKLKFEKEIVDRLKFGSVKKLLNLEDGMEAYVACNSEAEMLAYRYNKVNGHYPDLIRVQNLKTEKFLQNLKKFVAIPNDSYIKSFEDLSGKTKLNSIIMMFSTDGQDDLLLHMDDDEAMIFFNKENESKLDGQFRTLLGLLKGCTIPKVIKNKIYVVYSTQHGFEKIGFSVKKVNVDLKENYNDGFEDISKEIIDGLNSKKKTNLVILSGEPGTGKTTFIRYLTSKIKKNIIFISPDMVNQITDPAFIPFLIRNNDTVLIIEDAEPALQSRDGNGRTGAVSNVLNLTDGLLSDCLNISIVATFNTGGKNIDSALLRKGRLLKNYKFDKLSIDKSKALLNKLGHSEVEVKEPMTLADIYFYSSDNNTKEFKHKKIGF